MNESVTWWDRVLTWFAPDKPDLGFEILCVLQSATEPMTALQIIKALERRPPPERRRMVFGSYQPPRPRADPASVHLELARLELSDMVSSANREVWVPGPGAHAQRAVRRVYARVNRD